MTFSNKSILKGLDSNYTRVLLPWAIRHPKYLRAFRRLARSYKQSLKLRIKAKSSGFLVPPLLIFSITDDCNLHCSGCYAASVGTINKKGTKCDSDYKKILTKDQWQVIINEAIELGVFGFIIAGGEPFLFPRLLDLCKEFKDNFFLIFTNGTALTESDYLRLKKRDNVAIIVSIEGGQFLTDNRRGDGVYQKAQNTILRLKKQGTLSGISATINKLNYQYWMTSKNIDSLISDGIRLGFLMEYIPSTPNNKCTMDKLFKWDIIKDTDLMLSKEERKAFRQQVLKYRNEKRILLLHSPGDEELTGGCVSAGKRFAHINPRGDLTPCPVSNISSHNLIKSSLREGLQSQLFKLIRENEHLLETEDTPCALFAHPEEVKMLVKSIGAKNI